VPLLRAHLFRRRPAEAGATVSVAAGFIFSGVAWALHHTAIWLVKVLAASREPALTWLYGAILPFNALRFVVQKRTRMLQFRK
jgi:hypothetical protein